MLYQIFGKMNESEELIYISSYDNAYLSNKFSPSGY